MPVIEGAGPVVGAAAAPTAGTSEVQTLTIGGTPTGGTFQLAFEGLITAAIPWSNVNATLIAAIDSALEALPSIGTGNIATAAGTLTAGIGTVTLTWRRARRQGGLHHHGRHQQPDGDGPHARRGGNHARRDRHGPRLAGGHHVRGYIHGHRLGEHGHRPGPDLEQGRAPIVRRDS
jgi:hypothetical protein